MPLKTGLPNWISLLYLPAHRAEPAARPLGCRPDAVVLDLEDFVPWQHKPASRLALPRTAAGFAHHGMDVVVRINRPLDLAVADIDRAAIPEVKALMLTKLASADHVRLLDEYLGTLEARRGLAPGGIRFVGMVETAAGVMQMGAIAQSCERMAALTLGGEDLAHECRMQSSEHTLLHAKQSLLVAAAAAGILPWGMLASVVDFTDEASFEQMARRSRAFGFRSTTCSRAAQVEAINNIYAATQAELTAARLAIAAASAALDEPQAPPVDVDRLANARWLLSTERLRVDSST